MLISPSSLPLDQIFAVLFAEYRMGLRSGMFQSFAACATARHLFVSDRTGINLTAIPVYPPAFVTCAAGNKAGLVLVVPVTLPLCITVRVGVM
jgi:hypothetical protein